MRYLVIVITAAVMLGIVRGSSGGGTPQDQKAVDDKRLADSLSDLRHLFDRYGEVEDGVVYSMVTDDDILKIKKIIDGNAALRDVEDWTFIDVDPCSMWLKVNGAQVELYKLPLDKLNTAMDIGQACDTCSASVRLRAIDNERAVKRLTLYDFGSFLGHSYRVDDDNEVWASLSSLNRIKQAITDLRTAIAVCRSRAKNP